MKLHLFILLSIMLSVCPVSGEPLEPLEPFQDNNTQLIIDSLNLESINSTSDLFDSNLSLSDSLILSFKSIASNMELLVSTVESINSLLESESSNYPFLDSIAESTNSSIAPLNSILDSVRSIEDLISDLGSIEIIDSTK